MANRAKIIGIRPSEFKGDRGETITGKNIYVTYPLEKGESFGSERVFLTDGKLSKWACKPHVGDKVRLSYTVMGRCDGIEKAQ